MNSKLTSNMFHGRLSRLGFILGFLYYFIATFTPLVIITAVLTLVLTLIPHTNRVVVITPPVLLAILWYVVIIICMASLLIRRLHDMNRSGIMAWLYLVPLLNIALLIYVLVGPGSPGSNDYGSPAASNSFFFVTGLHNR